MRADSVDDSLREIAKRLPEIGVPYAVLGGMALVAHGYRRTTEDVDILVTPEGLERADEKLVGLGYRPAFEKSKNVSEKPFFGAAPVRKRSAHHEDRTESPPSQTHSKNSRDTRTGVLIRLFVADGSPGNGKPKPVAFPDPDKVAVEIDGIRYVNLPTLVELKLASGLTNPARLRDLADVQELIRALKLPEDFVERLNPYVHDKFRELAESAQDTGERDT